MALTKARLIEDNAIKAVHIDETATGITLADLTVTGALNANSGISGNITGNITGDVTGDLTGTVLTADSRIYY
jgi:cytoskeletal protein CcmA (bactofilin family)